MSFTLRRSMRLTVGRCKPFSDPDGQFAALNAAMAEQTEQAGETLELFDAWTMGPCRVLRSRYSKSGWHLSISHAARYPTWDEIAEARYQLIPDEATMAMYLPPSDQYVNLSPNCFHLYEDVSVRRSSLVGIDGRPMVRR